VRKTIKVKPPVVYDDGIRRVDYVGRAHCDVNTEIRRVAHHLMLALRKLRIMRRVQHPAVRAAIFLLQNIKPNVESHSAKELARVSFLMGDALQTLSVLKNSNADFLKEARFNLLYGQTPKKRDRDTILSGRKDRIETHDDEEAPIPEA
jgi:hypothetical protein